MLTYVVRRILLAGLTMALMSVLTFVVMQLPEGDYVDEMIRAAQLGAGDESRLTEDRLREFYGLDKPAMVQYWKWVSRIVTKFQFGHSFGAGQLTSSPGTYVRQEPSKSGRNRPGSGPTSPLAPSRWASGSRCS